jgi:hypothetical protein
MNPFDHIVPRDPLMDERFDIRDHAGYRTPFSRQQSPLAKYKNGARIVKTGVGKNDLHPAGMHGTVLGSIGLPEIGVGYFIEWDDMPRCAVFIAEPRIGPAP